MSSPLTQRQKEILEYIEDSVNERGYPPTLREICGKFSIHSTNGARYHLHRLQKLGYLKVEANKSRGVRPTSARQEAPKRTMTLPVLGQVPAGPFNYADPDLREDELLVDPAFFGNKSAEPELFGLRVRGDSMMEAGILSGDIVVVRSQNQAHDGDIVVAQLDDEATVKRYRRKTDEVVLEPANRNFDPIPVKNLGGEEYGQHFALLGVVVGVIRSM